MSVRQPRVENEKPILRWCAVHLDLAPVLLVVWMSPRLRFFLFPLHKGAVIAAPAGWQWFCEEYPKGHNRVLLYVAEQGTENLSPCCRHARFLSTWLTRLVARGSTTDGNERPAGHWSHLDPCFLSSRGFGRRSGPSVCWGEGFCFEPQPTCQPGTPPPPHSPGSPAEEV